MVNRQFGIQISYAVCKSFAKTCFTKSFFKKKKKNSRQYLLSVAFYERSLLILKDIFFQINLLKAYIYQIQKKKLYAFYEFFCLEMMALKNPLNFKRFLPSFPVA